MVTRIAIATQQVDEAHCASGRCADQRVRCHAPPSQNGAVTAGMTDRRRGGLLLLGLVLLAAVVVIPNTRSRTVPGAAQAAPAPGPPAVGDCVADQIDPFWNKLAVIHAASGAVTQNYTYPQLPIGRCQGRRYGEITALITTPSTPRITTNGASPTVNDPNMNTCAQAANRYVGISAAGNRWSELPERWLPNQTIAAAATTPTTRQKASGQHWLACIAYLGADIGNAETFTDQEHYDHSLRNALTTGVERDRIGTCAIGAGLDSENVGCTTAHLSEILATGYTPTPSGSRTDLQHRCRQLIEQSTGIPDITAAGLSVQVLAQDNTGAPITTEQVPVNAFLSCGVSPTSARTLDGSLIALGNNPIPWN